MKKLSLATAALIVAAQMTPAHAAPTEVEMLQSVRAAVDAGDVETVRRLTGQNPSLLAAHPTIAAELNAFVAAPRSREVLRSLDVKLTGRGKASDAIADIVDRLY